jgi:hypothetical protein
MVGENEYGHVEKKLCEAPVAQSYFGKQGQMLAKRASEIYMFSVIHSETLEIYPSFDI